MIAVAAMRRTEGPLQVLDDVDTFRVIAGMLGETGFASDWAHRRVGRASNLLLYLVEELRHGELIAQYNVTLMRSDDPEPHPATQPG